MVIPAGKDCRAVARHARSIPTVPGVAVVSVGCSSASASGGVSAVTRSMAVVTLGQCDRFNARLGGLGVPVQAEDDSADWNLFPRERDGAVSGGDVWVSHGGCGGTEEESGEGEDLDDLHGGGFELPWAK